MAAVGRSFLLSYPALIVVAPLLEEEGRPGSKLSFDYFETYFLKKVKRCRFLHDTKYFQLSYNCF